MRLAHEKAETALQNAFFVDATDSATEYYEGLRSNCSVRLSGDKGKKKYRISLLLPCGKMGKRLSFLCFNSKNALLAKVGEWAKYYMRNSFLLRR